MRHQRGRHRDLSLGLDRYGGARPLGLLYTGAPCLEHRAYRSTPVGMKRR